MNPLLHSTHRALALAVTFVFLVASATGLTGCGEESATPRDADPTAVAGTPDDTAAPEQTTDDPAPADTDATEDAATEEATTEEEVAPELQEVELELPAALFLGTPKEAPVGTTAIGDLPPREPLMAPAGTVNLAEGKPVTSSDQLPIIGDFEQITDGDKEATDGSYLELGSGTQWVQIDLEAPANIYGVLIWHFHSDPRIYRDVVVQVADDADFTSNVRTLFNNDQDNSSGLGIGEHIEYFENNEGHLVRADGVTAQYVRLYSKGNTADDQNHYIEVEVFGVPAK